MDAGLQRQFWTGCQGGSDALDYQAKEGWSLHCQFYSSAALRVQAVLISFQIPLQAQEARP
jgi:hypothetical protein